MTHFHFARLEAWTACWLLASTMAWAQGAPEHLPPASKVTVVTSLGLRIGEAPNAVIVGSDGKLYGTSQGNAFDERKVDLGTVFRVDPDGSKHLLHRFDGTDGRSVLAALVEASDGALYGSALGGGNGWGTVYRITRDGSFTLLHAMKNDASEGSGSPYPLIQARDGFLYGASQKADDTSVGALYRVSLAGDFSVVAAFGFDKGAWPSGPPLEGDDGNFYLTMSAGGSKNGGSLVSVTPEGVITDLADFDEGDWPVGGLVYNAAHDAMYGVTVFGTLYMYRDGRVQRIGTLRNCGSVSTPTLGPHDLHFYIACGNDIRSFTPDGHSRILAATPGHSGMQLAVDAGGRLYGTSFDGGDRDRGTVFRVTPGNPAHRVLKFVSGDR